MHKQSLFASLVLAMISSNALSQTNIETKKLDDIVISTSKSDKSIEDLQGAVTVITAEEIEKMNATSIKDVLVKTSGIVTVGSSTGIQRVSIRGTRPTDALILIDGKKTNRTGIYATAADFEYSQIPMSMIERIEIIKGPKSSIYGSDAMGGVINIITKTDSKAIWGELDLQGGLSSAKNGGDEQNVSGTIGGNISDKFSFVLGLNKYNKDATYGEGYRWVGFTRPKVNDATYIFGRESINGDLKLKYNIDDTQSVYASYLKGEDKIKQKHNPDYYKADRDVWSAGYEKNFEKVSLNLDYTNAKTDARIKDAPFSNQTHKLKNDYLKGEAKISALKYNYIVIGAETTKEQYERYRPAPINMTDQKLDIRANNYYIQDEIELGDFIFTLGTVLDDNEKYGNEFSPNIGVVYKIDDQQRLKTSFGEGFKTPDVKQGSSSYFAASTWGNDDLKPETSKNFEVGYEFYGQDTLFKTAIFNNEIENMIEIERNVKNVNQHQYRNIDKVNIKGFEAEFEYNFLDNHAFNVNYTLLKTENKSGANKGKEVQYRPKNTVNVGLTSDFDYGISSYLSANYVGTQYKDGANTDRLKAYTVANIQISKKLSKDLTARIGVDNIFDKHFDETKDGADYLDRRLAYVGINYKF